MNPHTIPRRPDPAQPQAHPVAQAVHELAHPLTPLRLQVALLRVRADAVDKGMHRHLHIMERNLNLLERMIGDLHQATKHHEMGLLQRVDLNLADVAADAVASLHAQATGKRVGLTLHAQSARINGDRDRLTQVLYNLIGNALKFTPPAGTIQVHCQHVGKAAEVRVTDSGRGLSPADMESLFRPYAQIADGDRERGSGLGLSICKQLVEAHGGRISVESEGRGKGSAFIVRLPVRGQAG